jgi:hypothetical protein
MQELYINAKKAAILYKHKNIQHILTHIRTSLEYQSKAISEIKLNGYIFNETQNTPMLKSEDIHKIEITVKNSSQYQDEIFNLCVSIIDQTNEMIIQQCLKGDSYSRYFLKKILESMDILIQLIMRIHQTTNLKTDESLIILKNMKACEMHLFSVIKAIQHAAKKNDDVIICDLLEHELADNLKQWKINIIPQLKTKALVEDSSLTKS